MMAARFPQRIARLALAVLAIILTAVPALAADEADAWAALVKGGHVAVIRHGNAPPGYGGDPPGFRFDDCTTQRNLDDMGRAQAKALGEAFRKNGVRVDRIASSPVCRCLETAELMAVGSVETSWNLLPDTRGSAVRVVGLKELVSSWRGPGTLVLVTHALTAGPLGFFPEQAETVVLQPVPGDPRGGTVVGRIAPPRSWIGLLARRRRANPRTTESIMCTAGTGYAMLTPAAMSWTAGPPTLPAGIRVAVLEGNPSEAGAFTMRLLFPAGTRVDPHLHPAIEHATVLSGTVYFGIGQAFETEKLRRLPVGSFILIPAELPHFGMIEEDTLIQAHGIGPWRTTYVTDGGQAGPR